jgi:hypothetical protein
MIVTCFAAMLVPTLFGDTSILDSLGELLVARSHRTAGEVDPRAARTHMS